MTTPTPARAVSPGRVLCRELDARNWRIATLATLTGIRYEVLKGIAYHDHPISERTAIALSDAFGTSIEFWLTLQAEYEAVQA